MGPHYGMITHNSVTHKRVTLCAFRIIARRSGRQRGFKGALTGPCLVVRPRVPQVPWLMNDLRKAAETRHICLVKALGAYPPRYVPLSAGLI
jgi:hypothetical protein